MLFPKLVSLIASVFITKTQFSNSSENETYNLPPGGFYNMDNPLNETPNVANFRDALIRNVIQYATVSSWSRHVSAIPSLHDKTLVWLQLLQVDEQRTAQLKLYSLAIRVALTDDDSGVERSRKLFKDAAPFLMKDFGLWIFSRSLLLQADEQKTAQLKMYALGSRVALSDDDSDVVERSRKLFKDAAQFFMKDFDRWIFSRSLVWKGYNGLIDDATLKFTPYDPLELLSELPLDPSAGIRCAEIFLFFAVDGDIPGDDLCSREAVMEFLNALKSEDGTRKIHAFTVTAGSVVVTREKVEELRGKHLTA